MNLNKNYINKRSARVNLEIQTKYQTIKLYCTYLYFSTCFVQKTFTGSYLYTNINLAFNDFQ